MNTKAILILLGLSSLAQAEFNPRTAWQEEIQATAPNGWRQTAFWHGVIPMVKWSAPKMNSYILVLKFDKTGLFKNPEAYLGGSFGKDKYSQPARKIGKIQVGGEKALLYERIYDKIRYDYGYTDMPPQELSRKTHKEKIVIIEHKSGFYVIRYSAPRWLAWWYHPQWHLFLNHFSLKH